MRSVIFSGCLVCAGLPAFGETAPYNMYGVPGLIDMPIGKVVSDKTVSMTQSYFRGGLRTTLTTQIFPRVSGSFRYAGHGVDGDEALGFSNWDRSFDVRVLLNKESKHLPALSIGLNDFIGTGRYSGEYIVATKSFGTVQATVGLGFGRLGSYGGITHPISGMADRSARDFGKGGEIEAGQWFQGDIAPFGGLQWQATPKLAALIEYSPDDYSLEKGYFDRKSQVNFGLRYQVAPRFTFGGYWLHGTTAAVSANVALDPKVSAFGSGIEPAPVPIRHRGMPGQPIADESNFSVMAKLLAVDGIEVVSVKPKKNGVHLQIKNKKMRSSAQVFGRVMRAASRFLADDVETITVDVIAADMPVTSVTLNRSDLEKWDGQVGTADAVKAGLDFGDTQDLLAWRAPDKRFTWSVGPFMDYSLFDPLEPIKIVAGLQVAASYKLGQGFQVSGNLKKSIINSHKDGIRVSNSVLPHVRSDAPKYARDGDPALERLTIAKYTKLSPDVYSRVTAGYLERMFAGVSGEVLWKPSDSRLGIGVEINHVQQRDFDQGFGLQDYSLTMGHGSLYYEMDNSLSGQLHVGRYLAGDWGATLNVMREFNNGWRVGAYATLTDVPFETFGEGSFDKGIYVQIPLDWIIGRPSQSTSTLNIQPISRDGGARLAVAGRLYNIVSRTDKAAVHREIGRFWK